MMTTFYRSAVVLMLFAIYGVVSGEAHMIPWWLILTIYIVGIVGATAPKEFR